MKTCRLCQTEKPLDQFYRHTKDSDRLRTECKECARLQRKAQRDTNLNASREWERRHYQKNRERVLANNRKWAKKNPEKRKTYQKEWRARHPLGMRRNMLKRNYGLTLHQYESMLSEQ